ncbi:MAG: DNA repair protein RecN [Bacteroidota bacterium]|nr:DNA repair protein RecN [Candidatus Kapabacteria bacterium]MCS7302289.1 DNA repair protein RecN [Candidatus Kapabacteria bacterium]MCX7936298.1 DNA repair protein RecN [Chlorobiota bacterium]MDW8074420.1 DNA repair protein RecN [Bacteroidota bacterium]MDW8271104.1 DNA repair protein RecN [Bacteroidota bacterium]
MLCLLRVENFAVIESVELEFGPAFNVITGETGAGKSLLVEALMAVLGERASGDMVRSGARRAVIEASFIIEGNSQLQSLLESNGYAEPGAGELILRREISQHSSRAFVNDSPAPVHVVRQLGEMLVDFHGQHEHQSLLKVSLHRHLLDSVGGLDSIVAEYQEAYHTLRRAIEQYQQLVEQEHRLRSERDWKQFRLEEIDAVAPQPGEKQLLESELRRIEYGEQLFEGSSAIYGLLYGQDHSVHDGLVRARNLAEQLATLDDYFRTAAAELRDLIIRTDELAKDVQRYNAQLEWSPERAEYIRDRLAQLVRLEKRYGSIEQALEERERLQRELALAENFEHELSQLRDAIVKARKQLGILGERLSAKRQQTARRIEQAIGDILARLGMPDAQFHVVIERRSALTPEVTDIVAECDHGCYHAFEHGIDEIAFHIQTNKGEPPAPLHRIISGGEASRVMLALKTILAKSDRLPILIFDEIDTGVSGRIAHRVGVALEELGAYHQVIAITHQPQIAARAQTHIVVEKTVEGERTFVTARRVSGRERVEELAKLIAGEHVSDGARKIARELLDNSSTYATTP